MAAKKKDVRITYGSGKNAQTIYVTADAANQLRVLQAATSPHTKPSTISAIAKLIGRKLSHPPTTDDRIFEVNTEFNNLLKYGLVRKVSPKEVMGKNGPKKRRGYDREVTNLGKTAIIEGASGQTGDATAKPAIAFKVLLPDDEAAPNYVPGDVDQRQIVERQIRERRGQQRFRDDLRKRYCERCLVTGCSILAVLEAAHIKPYRGEVDNHVENGLLLRADIHTLFDLDLIGIDPDLLRVELHPDLATAYGEFAGKFLVCDHDKRPSREALKLRYAHFQGRLRKSD